MIPNVHDIVRYLGSIRDDQQFCIDNSWNPPIQICDRGRWFHTCASDDEVAAIFRKFLEQAHRQFDKSLSAELVTIYSYWNSRDFNEPDKSSILGMLAMKIQQLDPFFYYLYLSKKNAEPVAPVIWNIIQSDPTGTLFFRLRSLCRATRAAIPLELFANTVAYRRACRESDDKALLVANLVAKLLHRGRWNCAAKLFVPFIQQADGKRQRLFVRQFFSSFNEEQIIFIMGRWKPEIGYFSIQESVTPQVAAALRSYCPNLQSLNIEVMLGQASEVCRLIAENQRLRSLHLTMTNDNSWTVMRLAPLTARAASLQMLSLLNIRMVAEETNILASFPALEVLTVKQLKIPGHNEKDRRCTTTVLRSASPTLSILRIIEKVVEIKLCIPLIMERFKNLIKISLHPLDLPADKLESFTELMLSYLRDLPGKPKVVVELPPLRNQ